MGAAVIIGRPIARRHSKKYAWLHDLAGRAATTRQGHGNLATGA
jgi:hypothetical protein